MAANDTSIGFIEKLDDFDRPLLGTIDWTINQANSAVNFAVNLQVNGVVRGTVTNNSRNDRAIMYGGITHKAATGGPLTCEWRAAIHTSLSVSPFLGLTDANTVEIPLEWSNAAFASNATDAIGFYRGASSHWRYGGVANDVDSTQGVASADFDPVLDTFQTFRVTLNNDGKGAFWINGKLLAENVAGCATTTVLLAPQASIRDDGAAGSIDVDYCYYRVARG